MSERTDIFQKEPIGIARLLYLKCAKEKFTPYSLSHQSYDEIYDRITKPTRCLRFLKYGISRNIFLQIIKRKESTQVQDMRDKSGAEGEI